ncbi:MAG TPA: PKD domain-containing protein, partial [Chitinophagaceae bacterium]|nr:PKD domain-containing protein [Chitinophagaceae bacterium]
MKLANAGNHYTYTVTSGTPIITAASVPAGLQHGDTLDIPANAWYASLGVSNLNGIAGDSIVIRFLPGSLISNNVGWASGEWVNASFIKVIGLNSHNNGSPVVALRAGCHSLRFTQCNFINDAGLFSNQSAFVADDKNGTTMYFSGAKSQTFYDVHIDKSSFNGFVDAEVITVGTGSLRSISLDFEIDHNSFKNITQDMALVPYAMNLSGYNFKIHDNVLDSIVYNATACRCAHNSTITLYGNGNIYNNKFSHSYANDMRIVPMKFLGLPGYTGPISVFNNIALWHTSYSMVETSPNNGVGRIANYPNYMAFTDTRIYYNTVYHTSRASYNGDYSGMVADVYPQQGGVAPVFVHNNVIIEPEQDRPWDPSRGYVIYFGGGPTPIDSGGNKVFQTLAQSGITDVQTWMPSAASPLLKAADASNPTVTSDIYGDTRPQTVAKTVGAVEALATAVPVNQPPVANAGTDISIVLPVNTATLNGSGSKDADGSITAYSWSMISGPAAATITNANAASASVSSLVQGVYAFRLLVTDNSGATAADTMQVSVAAAVVINQPPVASAGTDISIVLPVNTATLNGSGSKDADG